MGFGNSVHLWQLSNKKLQSSYQHVKTVLWSFDLHGSVLMIPADDVLNSAQHAPYTRYTLPLDLLELFYGIGSPRWRRFSHCSVVWSDFLFFFLLSLINYKHLLSKLLHIVTYACFFSPLLLSSPLSFVRRHVILNPALVTLEYLMLLGAFFLLLTQGCPTPGLRSCRF